jgi:hypothetical protein
MDPKRARVLMMKFCYRCVGEHADENDLCPH